MAGRDRVHAAREAPRAHSDRHGWISGGCRARQRERRRGPCVQPQRLELCRPDQGLVSVTILNPT